MYSGVSNSSVSGTFLHTRPYHVVPTYVVIHIPMPLVCTYLQSRKNAWLCAAQVAYFDRLFVTLLRYRQFVAS